MADLSLMFSRALAKGRADKGVPKSRAQILVTLLRKRAEAHRQGLTEHERRLRDQITWSLPMHDNENRPEPAEAD